MTPTKTPSLRGSAKRGASKRVEGTRAIPSASAAVLSARSRGARQQSSCEVLGSAGVGHVAGRGVYCFRHGRFEGKACPGCSEDVAAGRIPCAHCSNSLTPQNARDRKNGAICSDCKRAFVAESIRRYENLLADGCPEGSRYVETQNEFAMYFDKEWQLLLREGILAAEARYRRPIAI